MFIKHPIKPPPQSKRKTRFYLNKILDSQAERAITKRNSHEWSHLLIRTPTMRIGDHVNLAVLNRFVTKTIMDYSFNKI